MLLILKIKKINKIHYCESNINNSKYVSMIILYLEIFEIVIN